MRPTRRTAFVDLPAASYDAGGGVLVRGHRLLALAEPVGATYRSTDRDPGTGVLG